MSRSTIFRYANTPKYDDRSRSSRPADINGSTRMCSSSLVEVEELTVKCEMEEVHDFDMDLDLISCNFESDCFNLELGHESNGLLKYSNVGGSSTPIEIADANDIYMNDMDPFELKSLEDLFCVETKPGRMESASFSDESDSNSSVVKASSNNSGNQTPTSSVSNDFERTRTRRTTSLTLQDLEQYYTQPLSEASRALGLSATMLKKICRGFGIRRWPHRQLNGIEKSLGQLREQLHHQSRACVSNRDHNLIYALKLQITELECKKEAICRATSSGFNPSTLNVKKKRSKRDARLENIMYGSLDLSTTKRKSESMSAFDSREPSFPPSQISWSKRNWSQSSDLSSFDQHDCPQMPELSPQQQLLELQKRALELQHRSNVQKKILPLNTLDDYSGDADVHQSKLCDDLREHLKSLETSPKEQLLHLQQHVKKMLRQKPEFTPPKKVAHTPSLISSTNLTEFITQDALSRVNFSDSNVESSCCSVSESCALMQLDNAFFPPEIQNCLESFDLDSADMSSLAFDWNIRVGPSIMEEDIKEAQKSA